MRHLIYAECDRYCRRAPQDRSCIIQPSYTVRKMRHLVSRRRISICLSFFYSTIFEPSDPAPSALILLYAYTLRQDIAHATIRIFYPPYPRLRNNDIATCKRQQGQRGIRGQGSESVSLSCAAFKSFIQVIYPSEPYLLQERALSMLVERCTRAVASCGTGCPVRAQ